MPTFLKIILVTIMAGIAACSISFFTDKNGYGKWKLESKISGEELAWTPFYWANDSFGKRYYERTAMFIPAKIEGLPYSYTFQFDLGAHTVIYEKNAQALFAAHPQLKNKLEKLKSPLQFWHRKKAFKNLTLLFDNSSASAENARIERNYGETLSFTGATDSSRYQFGTIGADLFQNKILIIDYPNLRLAVTDYLPSSYHPKLIDIELDPDGRAILPLQVKGKKYKVLFDTGSSMFSLLTTNDKIGQFTMAPSMDTIEITSWGKYHNIDGREMKDSFQLAGQTFSNIKVYTVYLPEFRTHLYDGITGNALFWNSTVIIDFKNKKFGVL